MGEQKDDARVVALDCPNCGGSLNVSVKLDSVTCTYCGTRLSLDMKDGRFELRALAERIGRVESFMLLERVVEVTSEYFVIHDALCSQRNSEEEAIDETGRKRPVLVILREKLDGLRGQTAGMEASLDPLLNAPDSTVSHAAFLARSSVELVRRIEGLDGLPVFGSDYGLKAYVSSGELARIEELRRRHTELKGKLEQLRSRLSYE